MLDGFNIISILEKSQYEEDKEMLKRLILLGYS